MSGLKRIALLITTLTMNATVWAAMPLPFGWYLEANGGGSKTSNITYASGNSISSSGFAWNVNGGYKFMPYFAAEIGYTHYAAAIAKINGVQIVQDTHYAYDITGKGILPIAETGIELFAKLGASHINTHSVLKNPSYVTQNGINVLTGSHSATGYYFGLGADYSILQSLAINGQWQRAKGNSKTGNLDLYSIGLSYLFG